MKIYSRRPNLMIGFHGGDEETTLQLVNHPHKINKSQETFDWLGSGFYVWENNYTRALQWAEDKKKRGSIKTPSVVGVIYQLDYCLDFTDSQFIDIIPQYYELLKLDLQKMGKVLPQNKYLPNDKHHDLIIRELDCAVINLLHKEIEDQIKFDVSTKGFSQYLPFDTVRGIFTEGGPAFEGAGIQSKNHIQICIRNLNCIKGFFIPREEVRFP